MLKCSEQKNPIMYNGRAIKISDKAANAHYFMCNMPVTELEVSVYLGTELQEEKKHLERFTDEQLIKIVEDSIKEELLNLCDDESVWDKIPD